MAKQPKNQPVPAPAATPPPPLNVLPPLQQKTVIGPAPEFNAAAMPFGRKNYVLMLAGFVLIIAGFLVMSLDTAEFGFGFLGLTAGPLLVLGGFVVEFFAILKNPVT